MNASSDHLDNIIENQYGTAHAQIVFADIEKYSKRKSTIQRSVIEQFTEIANASLLSTSKDFIDYSQAHDANFEQDLIRIPTGDGLAVVFTFEGLERIHLQFAETLLKKVHSANIDSPCEKFDAKGWCNCHGKFEVKVGIAEGKAIVYKDLNNHYNVAGGPINLASRVMGYADGMQILLSDMAYGNLIDMTTDTELEDKFRKYENVRVKHGVKIDIFQYCPSDSEYINVEEPEDIRIQVAIGELKDAGMPFPDMDSEDYKQDMLSMLEMYGKMMELTKEQGKTNSEMEVDI